MNQFDFEVVSDIFTNNFKISPISHCDILEFKDNKIVLIEESLYINKNLLDDAVYKKEVIEVVRKMWGSFAILLWYIDDKKVFKKEKIFILKAKIDKRFVKILGKLIGEVKKYKNGAYSDVMFIEDNNV
jgi:hypothetical protein